MYGVLTITTTSWGLRWWRLRWWWWWLQRRG